MNNFFSIIKKDERLKISLIVGSIYLFISLLFRVFLLIYAGKLDYQFPLILFSGFVLDLVIFSFISYIISLFYRISLVISRFKRYTFLFLLWVFFFLISFLFFTEYFFFEEFNSRFNSVAVDYLIYPTEVFINIYQSYNVALISFVCFIISTIVVYFLKGIIKMNQECFKKSSIILFIIFIVLSITIPFNGFKVSTDRVKKEISKNGILSFFYAAYYHNLNYEDFYSTIDRNEAFERARKLVFSKGDSFTGNPLNPIERKISFTGKKPANYNIMVFVIESFGSEFIGALGSKENLTPNFDSLSREGILFKNIYSIGNRTVRGLEGIIAGFVPMPSESLIKMKFSENIITWPMILKSYGYYNYFVYGGRGIFDNMKPFAMKYGFDEFIEQKDYKNPVFKTIWGVCDEEIFNMSFKKAKESYEKGRKFFILTMSVSNHKPYTYPEGRIRENPMEKKRANAVKYTDWAIGDFFRKAKKESFYKNTIFVIIADHGARVYGSVEIPIKSYEIPLLIIAKDLITPSVNNTLGSSMDVAPTVMDILSLPYKSPFFGKSLLSDAKNRFVCLNHNRNVGYYNGKYLIVLGLNKNNSYYIEKGKSQLERIEKKDDQIIEEEKNAISLFQTASYIYKSGIKN